MTTSEREDGALDATARASLGARSSESALATSARVGGADTSDEDDASDEGALRRGEGVGRYVILSRVGMGAMGVVYAAYDPDLDRKVAVKLLRVRYSEGATGRARLIGEAQAMAQLAHPNVVAVHDVGTLGEQVWIAMEFIDGQTLSQWLKATPRSWRDVVAVFLRVAEGLVAAHDARLVHRDVKPDNIMVGRDGRVWVMDFGLARAEHLAPNDIPSSMARLRRDVRVERTLTHGGKVMGTPRYMAPEQLEGGALDARTDQYSYCVSLWEALHGAPPFSQTSFFKLANAVLEGQIEAPPPGARVPRWLYRIVVRGLSVDPERRWPSMLALIDALRLGQTRARSRRLLGALAALSVVVVAVGLWQRDHWARRAAHDELRGAVTRADTAEAALVRGVLQVRLGLDPDYDVLVHGRRQLEASQRELQLRAEVAGGPRLVDVLTQVAGRREAAARTTELVEQFKTRYAVLKQSSLYFPLLAAELAVDADAPGLAPHVDNTELTRRLLALLPKLLRVSVAGGGSSSAAIDRELAELAELQVSAEIRTKLDLLIQHARIVLEHKPALDLLLRELTNVGAGREHERLGVLVAANEAAEVGPLDAARWGLVLALVGLVSYVAAWLVLLRRARARARTRRGPTSPEA